MRGIPTHYLLIKCVHPHSFQEVYILNIRNNTNTRQGKNKKRAEEKGVNFDPNQGIARKELRASLVNLHTT